MSGKIGMTGCKYCDCLYMTVIDEAPPSSHIPLSVPQVDGPITRLRAKKFHAEIQALLFYTIHIGQCSTERPTESEKPVHLIASSEKPIG